MLRAFLVAVAIFFAASHLNCTRAPVAPPDPVADNLRLTVAKGPLPRRAFKAQISFAYEPPSLLRASDSERVHLLVKNASQLSWPSGGEPDGKYQIRVGNRWLDQNEIAINDGRSTLAYDLKPGDQAEVLIGITAPEIPGDYTLEFDLVQEHVAWFREMGSETLRLKLRVE